MTRNKSPKNWIPEIVYEEGEGQLPFIHVPPGQDDPKLLFIFVSHQTGEFEPGSDGEEVPVLEMDLKQFVDLGTLKAGLSEQEYDKVRAVIGLEPLRQAVEKGKKITQSVRDKLGSGE
jgi:hypothetical protein